MTTGELLLTAWQSDVFVYAVAAAGVVAYAARMQWKLTLRALWLALAAAVFLLAFVSPIGVLARGYLFSAHMLQHLLLVLVIPPLVLSALRTGSKEAPNSTGAPGAAGTAGTAGAPGARRFVLPWLAGVSAMWLWHAPTLCDAASNSIGVQRLQTVSLLIMGCAFFWPIVGPRTARRLPPFGAMVYLFAACVACTLLGILVTFSPVEVCSIYAHPVDGLGAMPLLRDGWGLTAKADQEIGGLLMWVPGCFAYAGGMLAMFARYHREEAADELAAKEAA